MTTATAVRELRLDHRMTMDQLATAARISKTYVYDIEHGSQPSLAVAMRLASALETSVLVIAGMTFHEAVVDHVAAGPQLLREAHLLMFGSPGPDAAEERSHG